MAQSSAARSDALSSYGCSCPRFSPTASRVLCSGSSRLARLALISRLAGRLPHRCVKLIHKSETWRTLRKTVTRTPRQAGKQDTQQLGTMEVTHGRRFLAKTMPTPAILTP
eukprot:847364-Rhodomonas_salina.1